MELKYLNSHVHILMNINNQADSGASRKQDVVTVDCSIILLKCNQACSYN